MLRVLVLTVQLEQMRWSPYSGALAPMRYNERVEALTNVVVFLTRTIPTTTSAYTLRCVLFVREKLKSLLFGHH